MPLRVITRKDTGTLWIVGTVTPAGAKEGVRVRRRAGSDNRRLAEEEAVAIEAQILRNAHLGTKPGSRSFASACTAYLTHQERSVGTIAITKRLLMHWRETPLSAITQEAVDEARQHILRPGASDATWRRTLAALSAILTHASRRGWCDAPRFDLPGTGTARTEFLTPAQYEALEQAAPPYLRPLLRFLVCTGSRLGEALSLEWSQVDLSAARVNVWADQTKGGKRRVIDLVPAAVAALVALPHRQGRVFLNAAGEPYRGSDAGGGQIRASWASACHKARLPGRMVRYSRQARFVPDHTPHGLRHTWATWWYALTPDPFRLKAAGDWSSVTLVERYAHLVPVGEEAGIRRVWGLDVAVRKVVG